MVPSIIRWSNKVNMNSISTREDDAINPEILQFLKRNLRNQYCREIRWDHLYPSLKKILGQIMSNMRQCKFFHLERQEIWKLQIFINFIPQIEITKNFRSQKVLWIHSQYLDFFNFNHPKTTFLLTTSYFLDHYFACNLEHVSWPY